MDTSVNIHHDIQEKALETIEWLLRRVSSGEIDGAQLRVATDTLFMAGSGLFDKDVLDLISKARAPYDAAEHLDVRVMLKDGHAPTILRRAVGASSFEVQMNAGTLGEKVVTRDYDMPEEAFAAFKRTQELLEEKGYQSV